MPEHIDPAMLEQQFAADFGNTAASFALLARPTDEHALNWLAGDGDTDTLGDQHEVLLGDARSRFEAAMAFSIAKVKPDKDGITTSQPYEAIGDDGLAQSVKLMLINAAKDTSDPYNLYKVFIERVDIDEQAGTRAELTREFWYISGSQYNHIPNGLEHQRTYLIVRPIEGGAGDLSYIEDETPELTQLNRLTRLVQQSPAFNEQKQGLGQTILGFISRKRAEDKQTPEES